LVKYSPWGGADNRGIDWLCSISEREKTVKDAEIKIKQAELILRLYDLRRETVRRQARGYIGGEFMPKSVDEFVGMATAGTKETGFILQVYGYWDMVAGFVLHGALDEALVYDTCQEMYFQYAKIQPYLTGFREKMNLPEFLGSIEKVIEGSEKGRARLLNMRNNIQQIAKARVRQSESP
jgi:hypothetical protein